MDGWNTTFLLGRPIFRGYVSFREGMPSQSGKMFIHPKKNLAIPVNSHRISWHEKCVGKSFNLEWTTLWLSWAIPTRDRIYLTKASLSSDGIHDLWQVIKVSRGTHLIWIKIQRLHDFSRVFSLCAVIGFIYPQRTNRIEHPPKHGVPFFLGGYVQGTRRFTFAFPLASYFVQGKAREKVAKMEALLSSRATQEKSKSFIVGSDCE